VAWHAHPVDRVVSELGTAVDGLSSAEALARLARHGANRLPAPAGVSAAEILAGQLRSVVVLLLAVAAAISVALGETVEAAAIVAVLVINALLGFVTEWRARRAMEALLGLAAPRAAVVRSGRLVMVDAATLVPGDVIQLDAGNRVPADARVMHVVDLGTMEAALTGESLPVSKKSGEGAYSGAIVKQGEMTAVVTATGVNTFFGRTAKLVAAAGNISHFQRAVMRIGNFLIILALVLVVILVAARLFDMRGHYDRAVLLRLAEIVLILLVASVPVAMPAVLSARARPSASS